MELSKSKNYSMKEISEVLHDIYFENLTNQEAAEKYNINYNTVCSWVKKYPVNCIDIMVPEKKAELIRMQIDRILLNTLDTTEKLSEKAKELVETEPLKALQITEYLYNVLERLSRKE